MQTFQEQYSAYQTSHQSSTSKMLHLIGVPAMIFGLLMFTNWISVDFATKMQISFAFLLVVACCAYYFMIDMKLAIVATVFYIILALIAAFIAGPTPSFMKLVVVVILVGGGFGAQYFGHSMDKTQPASKSNLMVIPMIPLFFLYDLMEKTGLKSMLFKN